MKSKLTPELAELIGLHTGDGTLYKTNWGIVWELRGGLEEKEFYQKHILGLLYSIFKIKFIPKFRSGGKNGCYGFQISKKLLTHKIIEFGFNPGRKSHTVRIPSYIFEASENIKLAYVRGLFDSDGCFRYQISNNKPYPRLEFCSASSDLMSDLRLLLFALGFKTHTWKSPYHVVCINGHEQLSDFLSRIKPANPKHLKRVQNFLEAFKAAVA